MTDLRLLFLGPPRLQKAGAMVSMDTRKAVAMLAYLAVVGEPQSRDSLSALLWPELDERRARGALRRTLFSLKGAVGAAALQISRAAIGLTPGTYWCDVTEFARLLREQKWAQAIALYRDDFLAGFSLRDSLPFDEWQLTQVQAFRREMEIALSTLCQQQLDSKNFNGALESGHRWLQCDPLREAAHRQLMTIYAEAGQRNRALAQFRSCVRILDDELGVTPLAETVALYEAIRENRFATQRPDPSAGDPGRMDVPDLPVSPVVQRQPPLIGRTAELAQIKRRFSLDTPGGQLIVIDGEVGIGKTRLAHEFVTDWRAQGAVVLSARCYEGESNLAFAPIIQVLQSIVQDAALAQRLHDVPDAQLAVASWLLPELTLYQDDPHLTISREAPGAQNRFFEGIGTVIAAVLEGTPTGALWLDDAQWLDDASLELLLFLARRWQVRTYHLLLCWRQDELPAASPLLRLVAEMSRDDRCEQLRPDRFSPEEVATLTGAFLPDLTRAKVSTIGQRLLQETEGMPLFVVEYLGALQQRHLSFDPEDSWDIPRTVRDLLTSRLADVQGTDKQLLQTAAAIGHATAYELLRAISGRSEEETVAALEQLVARRLLLEQGVGYELYHSKLRDIVYDSMSLARRRLLHRRVAEVLSQTHKPAGAPVIAGEIANHYLQAGMEQEAAPYYVQAGEQAQSLYAHRDALRYFDAALALGAPDPAALQEACGDMHTRLGHYPTALTAYETAASLADDSRVGRLEHKLAQVYIRQGAWQQAEAQLSRAKVLFNEPAAQARLYCDWSFVAFKMADIERAQAFARKSHQTALLPETQAHCYNISGILSRQENALDKAMAHFERSVELARQHDLSDILVASLNNLALAEMDIGRYPEALAHLREALALCVRYGDRHRQAALHNNLADLYHQQNDEEAAMAELKESVKIYTDIGGQTGNWQPEIWKLTTW